MLYGGGGCDFLSNTYCFGNLDENHSLGSGRITNDVIVDWSFRGNYNTHSFQVFGTPSVKYYGDVGADLSKDTLLRESRLNNGSLGSVNLSFAGDKSPFIGVFPPVVPDALTVISMDEATLTGKHFNRLLENTTDVVFRIALLNRLNSASKHIYPYLEYRFSFPNPVSDRFYTITAVGKYGNYEVKFLVKKPTIRESVLGAFTVIF